MKELFTGTISLSFILEQKLVGVSNRFCNPLEIHQVLGPTFSGAETASASSLNHYGYIVGRATILAPTIASILHHVFQILDIPAPLVEILPFLKCRR